MQQIREDAKTGEVTRLLRVVRTGDRDSFDQLFALVYSELRRVAERQLRGERDGGPVRPTELVNELYLKLVDQLHSDFANRAHFFGIAARAMRQLLVDLARRRGARKRGGKVIATTLTESAAVIDVDLDEVLALEDAVAQLEERQRQIVEYRFFGGMSEEEIAHLLGVSTRTVQREWIKARAWIYKSLYPEAS
jgi:RNA polymerase sigma factor (TIGR02999 family)